MKRFNYLLLILVIISVFNNSAICSTPEQQADSLMTLIKQETDADNLGKVKSLLVDLANIYEYDGDWENYEKVVDRMITLADETDDIDYKAECYNKLGISNCIRGKNIEALDFFSKSLEINIQSNDTVSIANSYENMGLVYKDMAKYDYAIDYQIKSIRIREKINYPRLVNNYVALSTLYGLMKDTTNQFKYLIKAKSSLEKNETKDNMQLAIIHNEIAGYYNAMGNLDSTLVNYQKVAYYSEIDGWKRGIAVGYGNIAEVYSEQGDWKKAIAMHNKVLDLSIEIDDCMSIAEEYIYLSVLYDKKGDLDSALYLAKESLKKTEECGLLKDQLNAYEMLYRIYESKCDYKSSLAFHKKYLEINDSIYNLDLQSRMSEIETQYQTEKKEQQIELLSAENKIKNQRIRLGIALILVLVLMISAIFFMMIIRRRNAQMGEDDLKQKLFRSQMNPHFIFNALGSIQNYMYKNENTKAAQYLGNFASLSRSILKYSSEEAISLEKEIETLNNYLELEQMRMKNSFIYSFDYNQDLEVEFINIPPMMIQPFIENSIKHGFKDMDSGGLLNIQFIDKEDLLEIIITDNGIGLKKALESKNTGHESMATKIFYDRIKQLKRKNKHIPDISIEDISNNENSGTKVHLFLPIFK